MADPKTAFNVSKATEAEFKTFVEDTVTQATGTAGNARNGEYDPRTGIPGERVPFVITTEQRLNYYGQGPGGKTKAGGYIWSHGAFKEARQSIVCTVNPASMDIAQGLRVADSKSKGGTVQYHWRDPIRKTYFDEPKVTFAFQSGNIGPFTYLKDSQSAEQTATMLANRKIPTGLSDFYEFMGLLDEDRITINGKPNYVYVVANSRKFPNITFVGFFDPEGIQIHDAVEDGDQVNWSASMTCRHTHPRLYSSSELRNIFRQNPVMAPSVISSTADGQKQARVMDALTKVRLDESVAVRDERARENAARFGARATPQNIPGAGGLFGGATVGGGTVGGGGTTGG